jgi:hypothetical protein
LQWSSSAQDRTNPLVAEGGRARIDRITKELWLCQPVRLEESPVWGTVYVAAAEAVKKGKITRKKRVMHDTPHHLMDPPVCGFYVVYQL